MAAVDDLASVSPAELADLGIEPPAVLTDAVIPLWRSSAKAKYHWADKRSRCQHLPGARWGVAPLDHALHIFLLHTPDFLGYPDGISLATDRPDLIERGLAIKKTGNRLMEQIGGRAIHPINVRLGGFYSVPHTSTTSSR